MRQEIIKTIWTGLLGIVIGSSIGIAIIYSVGETIDAIASYSEE